MFRSILKPKEILKLAEKVPNVEEAVLAECAKISKANAERGLVPAKLRYASAVTASGTVTGYIEYH